MRATFEIGKVGRFRRRFLLRPGESLRVGRTHWADVSFPGDLTMSDLHFVVTCDGLQCRLSDLSGQAKTFVNGAPVAQWNLKTGDQVTAGGTSFSVRIEREQAMADDTHELETPPAALQPWARPGSTVLLDGAGVCELAERAGLECETIALIRAEPTATGAVRRLLAEQAAREQRRQDSRQRRLSLAGGGKRASRSSRFLPSGPPRPAPGNYAGPANVDLLYEAVRLMAFSLQKTAAVAWAASAVRGLGPGVFPRLEEQCLAAAHEWIIEPSDEHAAAADQAAEAADPARPATWVARAASWHRGAATGVPAASPPNEALHGAAGAPSSPPNLLTWKAAAGAVLLAVTESCEPPAAALQRVLTVALEIA